MWVRGLKQSNNYGFMFPNLSHPMWVRGLKPIICKVLKLL